MAADVMGPCITKSRTWHWQWGISSYLSFTRKDSNFLDVLVLRNVNKCKHIFIFPKISLTWQGEERLHYKSNLGHIQTKSDLLFRDSPLHKIYFLPHQYTNVSGHGDHLVLGCHGCKSPEYLLKNHLSRLAFSVYQFDHFSNALGKLTYCITFFTVLIKMYFHNLCTLNWKMMKIDKHAHLLYTFTLPIRFIFCVYLNIFIIMPDMFF